MNATLGTVGDGLIGAVLFHEVLIPVVILNIDFIVSIIGNTERRSASWTANPVLPFLFLVLSGFNRDVHGKS